MISAYLRADCDSTRQCHRDLYFIRYVKFIRSSSAALPMTFVHSQMRASKKVNINYFVDISLNRGGSRAEGQCDCAVGSGPHATCNCYTFACSNRPLNESAIDEVTEKLQSM
ncbi:hypothetical protein PoB_002428100 [Plakobranchus ocellatus]|uniref:Uncharacterized protein n=1 Tax=Plakobranchus ocellatus TaxID=259542 RepID=A0AAV3ZEX0_9GAST|nr:hypothetical protein PoB_002428100 [Plakobranchus ocellatus]